MAVPKRYRFGMDRDVAYPMGLVLVGEITAATEFQSQEDRARGREPRQLIDDQTGKRVWLGTVTDPAEQRAKKASSEVRFVADVQPVPPTDEVMPGMRPIALEGLQVEPYVTGQGEYKSLAYRVWATGFADPAQGTGRAGKATGSAGSGSQGTVKDTSTKEAA